MKYILSVKTVKNGQIIGDSWDYEYATLEAAIDAAKNEWAHTSPSEIRAGRIVEVIESVNPDEDACDHFDGNPVYNPATDPDFN